MDPVDVVIVGAGISGISAAVHLRKQCPELKVVMLEARGSVGGTWDLFRYPGVRSDSDMHTLGFAFKPWTAAKAIADGPSIRSYLHETMDEYALGGLVRFHHKVLGADWDSGAQRWALRVDTPQGESVITTQFLFMCGGYYRYDQAYEAPIPGLETFAGQRVHPQFWPEDLDYAGKRVAVIGSGATAMTLVPAMAERGAQVTMVQRSPTYVVSRPAQDRLANALRTFLPDAWAYALTRWKNIAFQRFFYQRTRTKPADTKRRMLAMLKKALPAEMVEAHFTPRYNPWDERVCLVPDGDLFKALRSGKASVVTGEIETVTPEGIRLKDGTSVEADILVTATGLKLAVLSDIALSRDGNAIDLPETYSYKGMMFSGVPNLVQTFGYINASWTLRADLTSDYVARLLRHMKDRGFASATPTLRPEDANMPAGPWIDDFSPGYMQREMHRFPKQGTGPWRNTQDFATDKRLAAEPLEADRVLVFETPKAGEAAVQAAA